jgi:hypothetical protein
VSPGAEPDCHPQRVSHGIHDTGNGAPTPRPLLSPRPG